MAKSSDFTIKGGLPLSDLCKSNGLHHFESLCTYVQALPYGRITNKHDLSLVLIEGRGTCSTKHAFLAKVALENNMIEPKLFLGIYKMNESNTPGIGSVLSDHGLAFVPEAHVYLKFNGSVKDFTSNNPSSFIDDLLHEERIDPEQIAAYKEKVHKEFVKNWSIKQAMVLTPNEIWEVREQCIANLSNKKSPS